MSSAGFVTGTKANGSVEIEKGRKPRRRGSARQGSATGGRDGRSDHEFRAGENTPTHGCVAVTCPLHFVVEVAAARRPRGRERRFIGHGLLCANVWSNKTGFMMLTYLRSPQLRYKG